MVTAKKSPDKNYEKKRNRAEQIHERMNEIEEKEDEGTLSAADEDEYAQLEKEMDDLQPL